MSCDILQEYRNEILPPLVVGKAPAHKAMKERTIELCLLAGIVLLAAFIVMMLTKQFVLPFAGRVTEGFQSAATAGAASPPPNLQKMMMVLLGPGGGANGKDGDVFLSSIGTSFTSPKWQQYPPVGVAAKIRIEGGGEGSWLNFYKISAFDTKGNDIWRTMTPSAKSQYSADNPPHNAVNPTITSMFHSSGTVDEWFQVTINPPVQLSRIEIKNRTDACCIKRLEAYRMIVYDAQDNEIYRSNLSGEATQTYSLTGVAGSVTMATITGAEGRLFATNSANAIFATKPNTKLSEGVWNQTGGALKQVSRDTRDGRTVCGVNSANTIFCATKDIEFNPSWKVISGSAKWISVSNGRAACIGTNDLVSYTRNYMEGGGDSVWWQDAQGNLGSRLMKQVVLDETRIGAIDMEGIIYMADLAQAGIATDGGITGAIKWFQIAGKRARYLEMRLGRVLIIAEDDGKIYYSDDYRYGTSWQAVPMPDSMREVFMAGKDKTFAYTFKKADAEAECRKLGATLATGAQLRAAWRNGANWCSCSWTADIGKQYPNNENMTNWCGGPQPGLKDCGSSDTDPGNATCFGKKPSAAENVARFNTNFWNAPPLAIEFVPFGSTMGQGICGLEGNRATFKGEPFRYYTREECATVGKRITDGRATEFNAATGECRIVGRYSCYHYSDAEKARISAGASEQSVCEVNGRVFTQGDETKAPGCFGCGCCQPPPAPAPQPLSLSRQLCLKLQDVPEKAALTEADFANKIRDMMDDGTTGNCVFNADAYKAKYKIEGDIGNIYQHWIDVGLKAGYSPCGNINPSCRWDPDTYYKMNPTARGAAGAPRDPLEHYKQIGIKQGLKFCNASGTVPLLDVFAKLMETKRVVDPPSVQPTDIGKTCSSVLVAAGPASFETREVFLVNVPGGIAKTGAAAKCKEFGAAVATRQQLKDAQLNGGNWCTAGWIDNDAVPHYSVSVSGSCGGAPGTGILTGSASTVTAVTCYGQKPNRTATSPLQPFNVKQWSLFGASAQRASARRWTCENRAFADKLFAGPGNSDETYLGRDDVVCFTDNPETKTYYCRSAQEYRNGEDYSSELADSYEKSCNLMGQALTDLSGAMTTIQNIQGGLETGAKTIGDAASTLDQVYTKYNCRSATPEMKAMCNVIDASRAKIMGSSQAIISTEVGKEGAYTAVMAPLAAAKSSREAILGTMTKIQCPV